MDCEPAPRRRALRAASLAALLGLGVIGGLTQSSRGPGNDRAVWPTALLAPPAPLPALDHAAVNLLRGALLAAPENTAEAAPGPVASAESPAAEAPAAEAPAAEAPPAAVQDAPQATAQAAPQTVPLPVPRPPELRNPALADALRRSGRLAGRAPQSSAPAGPSEDDRNFFEKFFGIERQTPGTAPSTAMGYAALETAPLDQPRRPLTPVPKGGGGIAVYDITARVVTLPNGERLEAHSGLGDAMDNPSFVHVRMRGATPPGVYDLTEREALFHGVRAIRLNPVGGAGAVYNRAGLLAHTYMLGPAGASNGCISFRNYDRFLQAYLRGEVSRVVVVTGRPGDAPPAIANGATPVRTAKAGNDA